MRQNSLRMPLGVAGFRANVKKDGREPEVRRQRSEVRSQKSEIRDGCSLVMLADVFPHLVMPVGPLVPALRAPGVQMMSNAAVPEDFGHPVGRPAVLPRTAASHEPDVTARVLMEKPGITLVSHVVDRVVEVEVVVVHPVHGIAQVVHAGERVAALHVVGMFEESIGRVIRTERCAERSDPDAWRLALGIDKRENLVRDIGVVLRLHPAPVERMRSLVTERIALHAVDAEDPDAALLDVWTKGANHALTFLLPFVAHAGGEGEGGRAVIAVNGDAHVATKPMRIPTLMVTMHAVRGYPIRGKFQIPSTKFQSAGSAIGLKRGLTMACGARRAGRSTV